jgi:glycosyltransferase involved in cell wall biosynthesis
MSSMKILVDSVGTKHSGGARVLVDVVTAMLADDRVGEVVLLASPARLRQFSLPMDPRLRVVDIEGAESPLGRILWVFFGLRRACRRHEHDVFLGMNGFATRERRPRAVLVQQSLPFSAEAISLFGWGGRLRIRLLGSLMRHGAKRADVVYVQTPVVKESVVAQFGIAEKKVQVFLPSPPRFPEGGPSVNDGMAGYPEFTVLYVGNDSPYKNVKTIAEGMRLVQGVRACLYATIEPGHPLCRTCPVTPIGRLEADELHAAYAAADVLVMPSLTETVGLPMLEAMRAGTAVLAADRPYAHAVCGKAAVYFDPLSPKDFAEKLTSLLVSEAFRGQLVEAGRNRLLAIDSDTPYAKLVGHLLSLAHDRK